MTFRFSGSTWRFRVAAYLRSLARPRMFGPILLVAFFPAVLDRVVSLLVTGGGMFVPFLIIGVGGALLLVAAGALAALARRAPPSAVTFHERGIRETIGDRAIEHEWRWVSDVVDDGVNLTLHCKEPMRSLRLSSAHARLLVIEKSSPSAKRLVALLAAHAVAGPEKPTSAPSKEAEVESPRQID